MSITQKLLASGVFMIGLVYAIFRFPLNPSSLQVHRRTIAASCTRMVYFLQIGASRQNVHRDPGECDCTITDQSSIVVS